MYFSRILFFTKFYNPALKKKKKKDTEKQSNNAIFSYQFALNILYYRSSREGKWTFLRPLSPLFLDLRLTPTLDKNTHIGTLCPPPSSARAPGLSGVEWTNYIGLPSSSIQSRDSGPLFDGDTEPAPPNPQQCLVLQPLVPPLCDRGVLDHLSMGSSLPPAVFPGPGPTPPARWAPSRCYSAAGGECTNYFGLPSLPTPFLRSYRLFWTCESPSPLSRLGRSRG